MNHEETVAVGNQLPEGVHHGPVERARALRPAEDEHHGAPGRHGEIEARRRRRTIHRADPRERDLGHTPSPGKEERLPERDEHAVGERASDLLGQAGGSFCSSMKTTGRVRRGARKAPPRTRRADAKPPVPMMTSGRKRRKEIHAAFSVPASRSAANRKSATDGRRPGKPKAPDEEPDRDALARDHLLFGAPAHADEQERSAVAAEVTADGQRGIDVAGGAAAGHEDAGETSRAHGLDACR